MDRLINYPQAKAEKGGHYYNKAQEEHGYGIDDFIDQLAVIQENIAKRIEKGGECLVSNRDQAITWIPDRDMFVSEDQPCLQRIQFFVYEYPEESEDLVETKSYYRNSDYEYETIKGKAEIHASWRSRDLFAAWNSNMVGLIKMLNKEIFEPNNLELIRVVDFCNSLHIYEADWEQAKTVKPAILPPNLMR